MSRINVPFAKEQTREMNKYKPCPSGQSCLFCDAPLDDPDKATWVHMSTDLQLISTDEDIDEEHGSQGCFPVGPECIKKVPKKYRIKWKQEG